MKEHFSEIRKVLLVFLFLCVFSMAGSTAVSETEDPTSVAVNSSGQDAPNATPGRFLIKTSVTMVTTDVTVVGPDVTDLSKEDFVIYDNSAPHPVNHFSRNQLPLAVALLIDTSLSVESYLPLIQIAAGSALRNLDPEDQVVLYSFDNNSQRHSKLTYDRVEIAKKISELNFELGTDIYGTIIDASKYLQKNAPHHRRAIIMISDNYHVKIQNMGSYGMPSPNAYSQDQGQGRKALVKALESAVTVYSVKTPSTGQDLTGSMPTVGKVATDTGGEIIDVQSWTSLQASMEEVILKLRKQYTLGFNPSELGEDGSFHELEVKFSDDKRCSDCRILARVGYYAGIPSPVPSQEETIEKPQRTLAETDRLLIQQSLVTAGTHDSTEDLMDLPVKVRTSRLTDPDGNKKLNVKMEIDAKRIKFKMVDGKHACRLHIGVFYPNEKNKIVGSVEIIGGQLKEASYKAVMDEGLEHSTKIPILTEKPIIRVVIYDEQSDRVGSKLVRLLY